MTYLPVHYNNISFIEFLPWAYKINHVARFLPLGCFDTQNLFWEFENAGENCSALWVPGTSELYCIGKSMVAYANQEYRKVQKCWGQVAIQGQLGKSD